MPARPAEKAAGELAGIIGIIDSLVSWLLKTFGAAVAVGWLAQNEWALVLAISVLLYIAAEEYIKKSGSHHKSSSTDNKSHKDYS